MEGRLIDAGDTRLFVGERGTGPLALFVLHGGPGLDHTMFGDHLDGLGQDCRLLFVDQRAQGRSDPAPPQTWTLSRLAADVEALAESLGLERYAVLGHSFGAFVALQHAVDFPGRPVASIISAGAPSSRFLAQIEHQLEVFEPQYLREQVASSWARESEARTQQDCLTLMRDQLPFHFRDPLDPRIQDMAAGLSEMVFAPDVLRESARADYGAIEVEDRLGDVTHPVLVVAGRHDRACSLEANEAIARGVAESEIVVLDDSGHMTFVEQQEDYVAAVRDFLARRVAAA